MSAVGCASYHKFIESNILKIVIEIMKSAYKQHYFRTTSCEWSILKDDIVVGYCSQAQGTFFSYFSLFVTHYLITICSPLFAIQLYRRINRSSSSGRKTSDIIKQMKQIKLHLIVLWAVFLSLNAETYASKHCKDNVNSGWIHEKS